MNELPVSTRPHRFAPQGDIYVCSHPVGTPWAIKFTALTKRVLAWTHTVDAFHWIE